MQTGVACVPGAYRASVAKPNVLVVVAHPGVGGALETLLRIEKRYEIRRATKLGEASSIAKTWPADAAVVDAAMLSSPAQVPLGVPALVLTGSEDDGAGALARLDRGGAWARKDAGPPDIIAALDALLPGHRGDAAGPLAVTALGGLVVVFAALLLYLLWTAIV